MDKPALLVVAGFGAFAGFLLTSALTPPAEPPRELSSFTDRELCAEYHRRLETEISTDPDDWLASHERIIECTESLASAWRSRHNGT